MATFKGEVFHLTKVRSKSITLTYKDLIEYLESNNIKAVEGAGVRIDIISPHLGDMRRHDGGYITTDGELILTVIYEE